MAETLELVTDVLVIGGGPAGAWAAITARRAGAQVVLADKGYFGTSGATAPSNTETWCVPPGPARDDAVARQRAKSGGFNDDTHVHRVLETAWQGLDDMARGDHPFAIDEAGRPYLGNLRGPDYMRYLRRKAVMAGVHVLDHHPAIELIGSSEGVGGARGVDRQRGNAWQVRAGAVVLATGGCAFGERFIGAAGLTGDGYLMAVEAGAELSGMEYSAQYAVTPAASSLNKGMPFRFASFYDATGRNLGTSGDDRQEFVAHALRSGPVFACLDKADARTAQWLRQGQPNCFLPFDRSAIDPFKDRFEIVLRCEGTVRGVGGIRIADQATSTCVHGLFAAGDVVSREDLVGPVSGGGGPNASWAIASGQWAGRDAAKLATRERRGRDARKLRRWGTVAISTPADEDQDPCSNARILAAVGAALLPVEANFFRDAKALSATAERLDAVWRDIMGLDVGRGTKRAARGTPVFRRREAVAMLAAARWAMASALARKETRGMHRRTDHPSADPQVSRRFIARGLGIIEILPSTVDRAGRLATREGIA